MIRQAIMLWVALFAALGAGVVGWQWIRHRWYPIEPMILGPFVLVREAWFTFPSCERGACSACPGRVFFTNETPFLQAYCTHDCHWHAPCVPVLWPGVEDATVPKLTH